MGARRRRWAAALGSLLASTLLALGTAPPAATADLFGHDISWPQCPPPDGYSLPMPPESTAFVIIGLTDGLAFTENPCLASQVSWVTSRGKPAHGYAMGTFPTSAQLTTYGSAGPWRPTTRAARLSNVGYAEARFAVASMQRIGWRPPVVWIDVEPRPAQPWPSSTAAQRQDNRYVLEGLMRGLRDSGFSYGLYSYTSGWQQIMGPWELQSVPVWATAGYLDYPTEALDRCTQPSFSGGRVYISQWYDDSRDYDRTCGTYQFTPIPVPPSTMTGSHNDLDSDWRNDLVAREAATGLLWLYRGNGAGGFISRTQIGNGWSGMDVIDTVGDFSGDGRSDLLARERATGYLWLYPGNGFGGWLPRQRVGNGWNAMNAVFGPGDFNGDGNVDVLAREAATGALWLYPGNGAGGWLARTRVGVGWSAMTALVGPGDFNGDRTGDVLARDPGGYLWLYPGNGAGGWLPPVRVGNGWNALDALVAPGDLNGDRTADLLARDPSTGYLWLYPGNGAGGWLPRSQVGNGWTIMDALA
jgi:hypothetical protein